MCIHSRRSLYTQRSTRCVANTGVGVPPGAWVDTSTQGTELYYHFFTGCSSALDATTLTNSSGSVFQARLNSSESWTTEKRWGQWLQIALNSATNITSIATQGHHQQYRWTQQFLLYSSCDEEYWQPYGKVKWNISQPLHVLQAFLITVDRTHTKSNACLTNKI